MVEQFLSGVSRASIIRWTAIYLIVYAVIHACGGLILGIAGGLVAGIGAMTSASATASGISDAELAAATSSLTAVGGMGIGLAIFYLISVPLFAIAAFGLFTRRPWARMGAVVALGFSVLLSALSLNNGIGGVVWILISAFGIYLFWTDEGIRRELER